MAQYYPSFSNTLPRIQQFSLPRNIIYYISKNPTSSKIYDKLVKTCKYFYLIHPVIAFEHIWYEKECWLIFDKNEECKSIIKNSIMESLPCKVWAIDKLDIINYDNNYSMASFLSSKLYRSDLNFLRLHCQNMTLTEFKFIANPATIIKFKMRDLVVRFDENKKIVPIDELIEILPNLKIFYFLAHGTSNQIKEQLVTSETSGNLAYIPHFLNLKTFELDNFPETFHFETLFHNIKKPFKVNIRLKSGVLSNDYQNRLQTFVEDLVKNKSPEICPPYIFFSNMPLEPFNSYKKFREDYYKKKNKRIERK